MARSVFKRAVKMGSKEVRKSTLRSFNWPVEGADLYVSASQTLADPEQQETGFTRLRHRLNWGDY